MTCTDTPFSMGELTMLSVKRNILKNSKSKYKSTVPEGQLSLF